MSTAVAKQRGVLTRYDLIKEHAICRGVDIVINHIDSPREMGAELRTLMAQSMTWLVVTRLKSQFPSIHMSHEAIVEHTAEIYDIIGRAHSDLTSIFQNPDLRMLNVVKGTETTKAIASALNLARKQILEIPLHDLGGLLRQDTKQSYLC